MSPRKNTEAKDTAPAPTELTEDNIDDLDDEALLAAMEAMESGETAEDTPEAAEVAPEPSEAKETAKAEDADSDGEADDAKPDEKAAKAEPTIPKSRLDKEVAVRKAAEERAEAMQKRFDQLLEMRGKGEDKTKQEAPKQEQWIDPRKDIFGAYEQLRKGYEQLVGHTNTQYEQSEQQRQVQSLINESDADIEAFRSEAPDIDDAIAFLRESRKKELAVYGITDPQSLRQDLSQAQLAITQQAKQMGMRPAQLLYQIAGIRGYQPQAQPSDVNNTARSGAKPTASAADPSKLIEDVNKLEATKQRSQSLGGSGAPVEVSGITMEDLATMPEAEFKKLAKLAEEKGVDVLELVSA